MVRTMLQMAIVRVRERAPSTRQALGKAESGEGGMKKAARMAAGEAADAATITKLARSSREVVLVLQAAERSGLSGGCLPGSA
jgi:hypothetical protein